MVSSTGNGRRKTICRVAVRVLGLWLVSCSLVLLMSRDAQAYIDPGSTSLMWQLLTALFFGSLFYVKSIIRRVRGWFRDGANEE
jgi:hypothetical protein